MTTCAVGDAVDGSQVIDYEFRHDDGRADNLPLEQVKILFAAADSARGSSFKTRRFALLHIFGLALRQDHMIN
jgi:hypothetical protein